MSDLRYSLLGLHAYKRGWWCYCLSLVVLISVVIALGGHLLLRYGNTGGYTPMRNTAQALWPVDAAEHATQLQHVAVIVSEDGAAELQLALDHPVAYHVQRDNAQQTLDVVLPHTHIRD